MEILTVERIDDFVSGIAMVEYSLVGEVPEFKVDHPFVYGIIKSKSNEEEFVPLFVGIVTEN